MRNETKRCLRNCAFSDRLSFFDEKVESNFAFLAAARGPKFRLKCALSAVCRGFREEAELRVYGNNVVFAQIRLYGNFTFNTTNFEVLDLGLVYY